MFHLKRWIEISQQTLAQTQSARRLNGLRCALEHLHVVASVAGHDTGSSFGLLLLVTHNFVLKH
jgi:hypothetical protein